MDAPNPVLIEVTRGNYVESRHRGAVVVVDATGCVVRSWGNFNARVFARSAMKPIQVLPLIETGAAEAMAVSDVEIALACGSHSGEAVHVKAVADWLDRVGLGPDDLECGVPSVDSGRDRTTLASNCSGKHAGFLSTAVHLGETTSNYNEFDHPVQRRVNRTIAEMTGIDPGPEMPYGIDGCSIPAFALPLIAIARAMASLADPRGQDERRAAASRRLVGAMTNNPYMVAGGGRFDTVTMQAADNSFAVKTGAEGVHVAIIPKMGYGVALKIDDGSLRAADAAMAQVLVHLRAADENSRPVLETFLNAPVINAVGSTVGRIRPSEEYRRTSPSSSG